MPNRGRVRQLTQAFLPLEAVKLARWVPDVRQPHHGFHDPIPEVELRHHVHSTPQMGFEDAYLQDSGTNMALDGTILAHGFYRKNEFVSNKLSADLATIHLLDDPDKWFKAAISEDANRRWIEKALRTHGKIYMIIGYQTVRDARIEQTAGKSKEADFGLQAPGAAAITATTGLPVPGEIAAPGFTNKIHYTEQTGSSFTTPGQQVVAIQYRRIKFRFFSSRNLDESTLQSNTRWKCFWNVRGRDQSVDDVIEASLATEDLEDLDDSDSEE